MGYSERRLCQVLHPVATKVHAATWMYSRPQAANEKLQEYIQRVTDLVICATCTKKYKSLNDNDPLVTQVSAVPHSDMLAVQGQSSSHGTSQDSNQIQNMNGPILNWKANLTSWVFPDVIIML